jgi:hypothetical protein
MAKVTIVYYGFVIPENKCVKKDAMHRKVKKVKLILATL